jgi:hypothetical protein
MDGDITHLEIKCCIVQSVKELESNFVTVVVVPVVSVNVQIAKDKVEVIVLIVKELERSDYLFCL